MTVSELMSGIEDLLDEDYSLSDQTLNDDDDNIVNCVYLRNGEVVLQSNKIEYENVGADYDVSVKYILHCLGYFDEDLDVCFMYCDSDNDASFYDIDRLYSNNFNVCMFTSGR